MEISGKLDVTFLNFEYERRLNEKTDASKFIRVKGTWNIYFHGFMDAHCDIAYVQQPTELVPGIYEIVVYGEEAYLFLWHPENINCGMKGLITRCADIKLTEDAFKKYKSNQSFI